MTLATLIPIVVKVSIVLIVLALGFKASLADATYLFRRPGELFRALLAMNVLMTVFAAALAGLFDLHPAVKIALVALAVSPVPPILPKKSIKAGGTESYSIGLLVAASVVSVFFVPIAMKVLEQMFGVPLSITLVSILLLVLTTVLGPLAVGIAINAAAPRLAERLAKPVALIGTVLLLVGALAILIGAFPAIVSLIGNGTVIALAAFVVVGLAVGHLLGGPAAEDRTVLALCTASRHPAIAMAIAHANFPQQKLTGAAVLLYLLVGVVVSAPYVTWNKRRHAAVASEIKV